jgi:hypothetical protein
MDNPVNQSDRANDQPERLEYSAGHRRRHVLHGRVVGIGATLALLAVLAAYALERYRERKPAAAPPPPPPGGMFDVREDAAAIEARRTADADAARITKQRERETARRIYRDDVLPVLAKFDRRNQAAADRALANMHERLDGRRSGIKPFIRDVNSWKTRFGVMGRTIKDTWQKVRGTQPNPQAVRAYVDQKFRHHVLSEPALEADVGAVLAQFREDLEASRNQLYTDLRLPLSKIKVTLTSKDADFQAFLKGVQNRASDVTKDLAGDSVVSGLTAFVSGMAAGEAAELAARQVVASILSRVGTQMAARAVTAGGATVAGAAAGGGGGSFAGPAGTVIGLGVGFAAGAVVDWWMSEKFEAKMNAQLNAFFDNIDHQLIKGSDNAPGLEKSLQDAIKQGGDAQRNAIEHAIEEVTQ